MFQLKVLPTARKTVIVVGWHDGLCEEGLGTASALSAYYENKDTNTIISTVPLGVWEDSGEGRQLAQCLLDNKLDKQPLLFHILGPCGLCIYQKFKEVSFFNKLITGIVLHETPFSGNIFKQLSWRTRGTGAFSNHNSTKLWYGAFNSLSQPKISLDLPQLFLYPQREGDTETRYISKFVEKRQKLGAPAFSYTWNLEVTNTQHNSDKEALVVDTLDAQATAKLVLTQFLAKIGFTEEEQREHMLDYFFNVSEMRDTDDEYFTDADFLPKT